MSRSIKKHGVLKDKGLSRSEYNKIFRRVNRQRVEQGLDPKEMNEIVNPYDVCDYIFFWKKKCSFQYNGVKIHESEAEFMKRKRTYFQK